MKRWIANLAAMAAMACSAGSIAQQNRSTNLAGTPPLGWNSWDSYGLTITEAQFRANVDVLRDKLKPFGWRFAVIDEGWFFTNPEARPHPEQLHFVLDANGRYVPAVERFPSARSSAAAATPKLDGQSTIDAANRGFIELGRWVHAQGLLFGIHIVRGIPRESVRLNLPIEGAHGTRLSEAADTSDACPWDPTNWGVRDNAAGQAWYDALLRQYANWGVDLLKVDCIADHPYKASEIRQIRRAIDRSGRPMVLSLSPGPTNLAHAAEVASLAQMWRISDDVWDVWASDGKWPQTVRSQFTRLAAWEQWARPGNWPDADMLPLGELAPKPDVGPGPRKSRLSNEEQRTQITLWAIARSPLILGANLTMLDDATLQLITNRDLLRVNQTATSSREQLHDDNFIAWTADLPHGGHAVAIFNTGDAAIHVKRRWNEVGLPTAARLHDVWTGAAAGASLDCTLPPHASRMFVTP